MKLKRYFILGILVICLILTACGNSKDNLTATTMKLLGYEGTVSLEADGKSLSLRDDMQLHNGNAIATDKKSYADISLDDTKTVGLEEQSRAEFNQDDKHLKINLTDGSIYFYTTEKLADDETFQIETDTMMVGIRGTSGIVSKDKKNGEATIYLTSGSVKITGINKKTGATKKATVKAGESLHVYNIEGKSGTDSVTFSIDPFVEEQLPQNSVQKIMQQPKVVEQIVEQTGFSKEALTEVAKTGKAENTRAKQAKEEERRQTAQTTAANETATDTNSTASRPRQVSRASRSQAVGVPTEQPVAPSEMTAPTPMESQALPTPAMPVEKPEAATNSTSDSATNTTAASSTPEAAVIPSVADAAPTAPETETAAEEQPTAQKEQETPEETSEETSPPPVVNGVVIDNNAKIQTVNGKQLILLSVPNPQGEGAGYVTLSATVSGTDLTDSSVTWSASNPDAVSVSSDGTITAKSLGTSTIYATSNQDNTTAAQMTVTSCGMSVTPITFASGNYFSGDGLSQVYFSDVTSLQFQSGSSIILVNTSNQAAPALVEAYSSDWSQKSDGAIGNYYLITAQNSGHSLAWAESNSSGSGQTNDPGTFYTFVTTTPETAPQSGEPQDPSYMMSENSVDSNIVGEFSENNKEITVEVKDQDDKTDASIHFTKQDDGTIEMKGEIKEASNP